MRNVTQLRAFAALFLLLPFAACGMGGGLLSQSASVHCKQPHGTLTFGMMGANLTPLNPSKAAVARAQESGCFRIVHENMTAMQQRMMSGKAQTTDYAAEVVGTSPGIGGSARNTAIGTVGMMGLGTVLTAVPVVGGLASLAAAPMLSQGGLQSELATVRVDVQRMSDGKEYVATGSPADAMEEVLGQMFPNEKGDSTHLATR